MSQDEHKQPDESQFDDETKRFHAELRGIVAWARSAGLAPHAYLAKIFRNDRTLPIDQAILAIVISWLPIWLLFIALAISPQGQDLLNHLKSDLGAALTFSVMLIILCVVAVFIATALLAAWHFPRVARASLERSALYGLKVPSWIEPLTHQEIETTVKTARIPILLAIIPPLAFLIAPIIAALTPAIPPMLSSADGDQPSWAVTFVVFVVVAILLAFVAWGAVAAAARSVLNIVAAAYLIMLLGFAGLLTISFLPVQLPSLTSTEIIIVLIAICWLLVFFGLTFNVYVHRRDDAASDLPDWLRPIIPGFMVRHWRLILMLTIYAIIVSVAGLFFPRQSVWMRAANGDLRPENPGLELAPKIPRMDVESALKIYRESTALPDGDKRLPVFLVTAAGGGIRAAYWTGAVLGTLQDRYQGGFSSHLFAISAVSGGALGASTYKALVRRDRTECEGAEGYRGCATRFLAGDFIGPNIIAATTGEVVEFIGRGLLPFPSRDEALEGSWAYRWSAVMGPTGSAYAGSFDDLFVGQPTPALLLNGASLKSGERVVTSNLDISSFIATSGEARDACPIESSVINPAKYIDIQVSAAVLTSARFPYITPPALLRLPDEFLRADRLCRNWEQIVDGGYIDNEGILTMRDLLRHMVSGAGSEPGEQPSQSAIDAFKKAYRVVLIRLSAEPTPASAAADPSSFWGKMKNIFPFSSRRGKNDPPPRDNWKGPISALMNQRGAANQHLVKSFRREVETLLDGCWIEFNALDDDAPLGWTLSNASRKRLDAWLDGAQSAAWEELYGNTSNQRYRHLLERSNAVDFPGKLNGIAELLVNADAPCPGSTR